MSWDSWDEEVGKVSLDDNFLECFPISHTMTTLAWTALERHAWAKQEHEEVSSWVNLDDFTTGFGGEAAYGTSVHHLYHLYIFEKLTGVSIFSIDSVLEWGAGYGDIARMMHIFNPAVQYNIIDLPNVSELQHWYLSQFGFDAEWQQPKKSELFIATWSLSESPESAIEEVVASDWFGCEHGLLAWQIREDLFPATKQFEKAAVEKCVVVIDALSEGSFYGIW